MSKIKPTMSVWAAMVAVLLLSLSLTAQAATRVEGVRVWPAPDHTRLVLDTEGQVAHNIFHWRTRRAWSLT